MPIAVTTRRPWLIGLAGLAVALGLVVAFLPQLAGWLAVRVLDQRGLGPASLTVESLTPSRLVVTNISVAGGKFSATSVALEYTIGELVDAHVRALVIDRPNFTFGPEPDSPPTGPTTPPGDAPDISGPRPRVDRLEVRDGTGTVMTPGGALVLTYNAALATADGRTAAAVSLDGTGAGARLSARLEGSGTGADPATWRGRASVNAILTEFRPPELDLALTGSGTATIDATDRGIAFVLDSDARAGEATIGLKADGRLDAGADGSLGQDFSIPTIELTARAVPFAGQRVDGTVSLTDARGPIAVAGGLFNVDLRTSSDAASPLASAEIRGRGDWRRDGLSLSFELAEFAASASDIKSDPATRLAERIALGLAPATGRTQQVNLVFSTVGGMTLAPDLGLSLSPVLLWPETTRLFLQTRPIEISGYAALGDGDTRIAIATGLERALKIAALARSNDAGLAVDGTLATAGGSDIGTFALVTGGTTPWRAVVKVPELSFGSGGVAWSELFGPLLDLRSVEGSINLAADLSSAPNGIAGTLTAETRDLGFDWNRTKLTDLDARIAIDRLDSLAARDTQSVSLARIEAAIPIENARLDFDLPGDGTLQVRTLAMAAAGGTIAAEPAVLRLDGTPSLIPLAAEGLDLGKILAATTLQGLDATGTISGPVPTWLESGAIIVKDGLLAARNGIIRYRPAQPSAVLASGGAIVGQALANFQYEELKAVMNGDVMKDLKIAVGLKGKNPDLMRGYPVEFNLNFEGPLGDIAASGLSTYRIPDTIRDRIDQNSVTSPPGTQSPQ